MLRFRTKTPSFGCRMHSLLTVTLESSSVGAIGILVCRNIRSCIGVPVTWRSLLKICFLISRYSWSYNLTRLRMMKKNWKNIVKQSLCSDLKERIIDQRGIAALEKKQFTACISSSNIYLLFLTSIFYLIRIILFYHFWKPSSLWYVPVWKSQRGYCPTSHVPEMKKSPRRTSATVNASSFHWDYQSISFRHRESVSYTKLHAFHHGRIWHQH